MAMVEREDIITALNGITDPASGRGLYEAGLVRGLVISPGRVGFMLEVPAGTIATYGPLRLQAEKVLLGIEGVKKAQVVLTNEVSGPDEEPADVAPHRARLSPQAINQAGSPARPAPVPTSRPDHVKHVIVVGSGKGGVGKSSIALALALGLRSLGLKVGLMDADIYGPSLPLMLGVSSPPEFSPEKLMIPPEAYGLLVNSVGFLVDADQAMIWRGPMASQAVTQLLTQSRWGTPNAPMDVLVIDLPPGTGDVQLTLTQKTLIDGAVVVSTPQDMALIDARRAVTLFEKTHIPVLGVVENMAYFQTPDGQAIEIFGRGGAKAMAERLKVPFLGEVPLDPALRKGCDEGRPYTALEPQSEMASRFKAMAQTLISGLKG